MDTLNIDINSYKYRHKPATNITIQAYICFLSTPLSLGWAGGPKGWN